LEYRRRNKRDQPNAVDQKLVGAIDLQSPAPVAAVYDRRINFPALIERRYNIDELLRIRVDRYLDPPVRAFTFDLYVEFGLGSTWSHRPRRNDKLG
jgi:hypothetical protein